MKRGTIPFTLIFIGLGALILFTSTDVVTLFAGQHTFVSISDPGNQIKCTDCHNHIQNELSKSAIHADLSCENCHRFTGTGIMFASGDGNGSTPGNESHAAYTPRCLDCHNGSGVGIVNKTGSSVHAPPAPAFNESDYGTDYSAHKRFVLMAKNSSMGENGACIACHTNYSCQLAYSYFYNINYTVSSWTVPFSSFSYNGMRNYDIRWSKSGATHEFIKLSDIDCTKCHKNIYEALVNGTPDSPSYLTHAPIEKASDWDTDNPWNHYRYHYIPAANRAAWVNNSYCYKCHNVKEYANEHPSDNTTYVLGAVTSDTRSTEVHCAEALTCATCHGSGKTKYVIDNPDRGGGGSVGHSGTSFVDNITSNYARTFNGDICMGCHEAAVHPSGGGGGGGCSRCHGGGGGGGGGGMEGNANVYIESEPSGYATNN